MSDTEQGSNLVPDFLKPIEVKGLLDNAIQVNFLPCHKAINQLVEPGECMITLIYQSDKDVIVSTSHPIIFVDDNDPGIGFKIFLEERIVEKAVLLQVSYGLDKPLRVQGESFSFETISHSVIGFKTDFPALPQTLNGRFSQINKVIPNKYTNGFNRLFLQIPETDFIGPDEVLIGTGRCVFDHEPFNIHRSVIGIQFRQGVSYTDLNLAGGCYRLYSANKQMYFIDGLQKENLNTFQEKANVIRKALALLTGKYFSGDVIYFSAETPGFEAVEGIWYEMEKPSLLSGRRIHDANLFKTVHESPSSKYEEGSTPYLGNMTPEVFSSLCTMLWKDENIRYACDLVLGAASNSDPVQQGVLYSAALESLTGALGEKKMASLKPVGDTKVFDDLKSEFLTILESKAIGEDAKKIIKARIENLNSPTNQDKLVQTFALNGITLSAQNKKAINERNKYLHGKSPLNRKQQFELKQITLELHTLLLKLLLKVAGYSGYVVNLHMQSHLIDETKRQSGELELLETLKKAYQDILVAQEKGDEKMFKKIKEEMNKAINENILMNVVDIV